MKTARRSFGDPYECQKPWDEEIGVQCGSSGVVLDRKDPKNSYTTAFFEAFPKKPDCFLRGEGSTVEEAEAKCWEKYQKVLTCEHEMERRDRRDGYGYCKHCAYSSTVFEPLDKCCKCGVPTSYAVDYRGKHYCRKHSRNIPKNPNPTRMERMMSMSDRRLPRKEKKLLKNAATYHFRKDGDLSKVTFSYPLFPKFKCGKYEIGLLFGRQRKQLLHAYRTKS